MVSSRIKNPDLIAQIDIEALAWHRHITPLTEHYRRQLAGRDYRGKRLAYWGHIRAAGIIDMLVPLQQAGAEVVVGACNVESTDDAAAAYATAHGITVYGWKGMGQAEYQENLMLARAFDLGETYLFLLAQGSLLNLAVETGLYGADLWDHFNAVLLLGIMWMFDGIPADISPGVQLYPAHLEREIAELSVRIHGER